ncbi:MAG: hypothetical protein U1F43_28275 [Myxococcota bacterium]
MPRLTSPLSVLVLALPFALAAACGGKSSGGGGDYPGTADGAKAMVTDMLKGDMAAIAAKLKPSKEDIAAIYDASVVDAVNEHVEKMFAELGGVGAKEGQSEVVFMAATSEDFKAGNDAAKKFPGGYARIADKLKPGVTFYAWKYVKPGESSGMAFDGLVFVNGHWVWIPKSFRAIMKAGG